MSGYPTFTQFAEQLGTPFSATLGEGCVEFELVDACLGNESTHYAPFTLEFVAPGEPLPQQTYALSHEVLGTHLVFLVPIAREGDSIRYEAVFNVAKESEG
jgi:hypothetical protein